METKYRCLIVDDEKPAHEVIKSHISKLPQLQYEASVYNGKEALDILQTQPFDIVFLDIEMPIVNGIELLQALQPKPAVIMVTAYTEFAFAAYQHEAVDYLQKPISYIRFHKAVEKAMFFCEQKKKIENTITHLKIKVDGEIMQIPLAEIMYCNSMGNYVKIITSSSAKPLIVYDALSNIYDSLDKNIFVQVHRSYIVNKLFIQQTNLDNIVLLNSEVLPVGRKYGVLLE
jgi:two-component system, LytTR family, response regulator